MFSFLLRVCKKWWRTNISGIFPYQCVLDLKSYQYLTSDSVVYVLQ